MGSRSSFRDSDHDGRRGRLSRGPMATGGGRRRDVGRHVTSPRPVGMDSGLARFHSRPGMTTSKHQSCPSRETEGAGNAGCWPQPMARLQQKAGGSYHRFSQIIRHSLRDGFNAYSRALPGVHDLVVTVAGESSLAHLAPAQGCQDHTTSPSANALVVRASSTRPARLHPPHPAPHVS